MTYLTEQDSVFDGFMHRPFNEACDGWRNEVPDEFEFPAIQQAKSVLDMYDEICSLRKELWNARKSVWELQRRTKMTSRHQQAIEIQQGACNMIAIANVLVKAIQEARSEGKMPENDEAVRLIIHQMGFLCNMEQLEEHIFEYDRCIEVCEERVNNSEVNK